MWVMITGFMVFFMNLGFGCVEAGFCRAKNCVNILSKNFIVFAVSTLGFWIIGWGLMFGNGNDFIGQEGLWMVSGVSADGKTKDNSPATGDAYVGPYKAISWPGVPLSAKFFFQLVFAGTAATIVSGAVAERIKYHSFIVFSLLISIFIYPVVGHWIWGGGWLALRGFFDFAGSTQVHSIGGWCALTGILFLGPRKGKYSADGKALALPGHSMMAAFIGCLVLWFGWFGFNPGSTMTADAFQIADIAVTTNMGAAIGTLTATATAWILLGKPDIGMTLNGCLAGLVAVTAPCAFITPLDAGIIGGIGGILVVLAVIGFDKVKIDDPVGATSVHLVNGVFGTLCIGLFAHPDLIGRGAGLKAGLFHGGGFDQLIIQATGVGATAVYVLIASSICWLLIKVTLGLRVSDTEEMEGLDHGEHGNEAYHGFVMSPLPR
jgi:Amt family ammonium transporter